MIRCFAIAAATVAMLLPGAGAQARQAPQQTWGVSDTPQTSADGSQTFCMLWSGRSPQPLVNIWLSSDGRLRLNLSAAELAGGTGGQVEVSLRFPRGQTGAIAAVHVDRVIAIGLSEAALATVLDELRHDGDFVATVNGHSFSFPVSNLSSGVDMLLNCRRQLPAS